MKNELEKIKELKTLLKENKNIQEKINCLFEDTNNNLKIIQKINLEMEDNRHSFVKKQETHLNNTFAYCQNSLVFEKKELDLSKPKLDKNNYDMDF
ncbi:hypothetical protein N5T77_10190 [Aliarcobacter cryaerophilus]|uniref:hypothetical protein n=1 Tax=Aliarcobacter cryaerophilus TaxID=28198 RepID=UPI0021B5B4D9|nr:hypothetical protein [Aliarcobacter cryaerophilus]MCT7525418.1 hypothetical protein [Aliarcobacter cryaerophilus]